MWIAHSFPCLSQAISDGRIDQVEAARVLGAGLVVTLRRVVESAMGVEKLDDARVAAAIGELHCFQHAAGLEGHPVFDQRQQCARRFVLPPRDGDFVVDLGLQRAGSGFDLALLPPRKLFLALVAFEDRQQDAEEEAEGTALARQTSVN